MSDDTIVFPCPACGTKYSVSPHHAGKKTTCKKCGAPVTVPTPQVANPTIVGGTRTIRRADFDPGASAREEAVDTGRASEVDMSGGASVLRKEETVIGAPPMAPITRTEHARGGTRPAPSTRQAPQRGRPSPYGGPGVPAKKSNMPMMLGIGGGVLGLILVVVLIVVMSGDGGGSTGADGGGGDVAAADGGAGKVDAEEQLLKEMKNQINNEMALTLDQVKYYYAECEKRKDNVDFRGLQALWAKSMASKAMSSGNPEDLAEIALLLDDNKYADSRGLLDAAWRAMKNAGKATTSIKTTDAEGRQKMTTRPNPKFKAIVERLGWKPYTKPAEMDEAQLYECTGAKKYNDAFLDVDQVYRDVELYPPDVVENLVELQKVALASLQVLKERDAADGFAINARKAWLRFKQSQGGGKVDRSKGKRSFSAKAMGRDGEEIENVWTYTYWSPFMVYVEKPIGQDSLSEEFVETLESKAALLKHLNDWFRENLIDRYNLQRAKPQYDAALAEKEGWPLEIVVLKDSATFEAYVLDVLGRAMPGARAFYTPLEERVMTYDDRSDSSPDTKWFNESVLIHETFHMLSDFYAANPMFKEEDMQLRPRYPNILVQEGLTDSVSGFTREGEGGKATYDFLELNHIRLRDFQDIYKMLGNKLLYRVRDAVACRNYGQCTNKAFERAAELGLKVNPRWLQSAALGIYYPSVCQMSFFFQNYKEGSKYVYRDKWWDYIGQSYKGEIVTSSWSDNTGITKFKELFGIKTDKDWDELDKKFIDYTIGLTPENVGKGGGIDKAGSDDEESVKPGIPPMPGYMPGSANPIGISGRDDE